MRVLNNLERPPHGRALAAVACMAALATIACVAAAKGVYPRVEPLLASGETIIGQPVAYPTGAPAQVTAAIVTLMPGEETGWHIHNAPLFGYILAGELTVDYGPDGTRRYTTGDALLEAIRSAHNGTNTGTVPVRILTVEMSEKGMTFTEPAGRAN